MGEHFDFDIAFRADFANLRQRHFPRQNHAGKSQILQRLNARQIMDGHLRAGMKRKPRRDLPRQPRNAEILHQDSVRPRVLQEAQIIGKTGKLRIVHRGIHRDMHSNAAKMRIPDRLPQARLVEILRVGPRAEPVPRQIYSVRPVLHGSRQSLPAPRRRQKLNHDFSPCHENIAHKTLRNCISEHYTMFCVFPHGKGERRALMRTHGIIRHRFYYEKSVTVTWSSENNFSQRIE